VIYITLLKELGASLTADVYKYCIPTEFQYRRQSCSKNKKSDLCFTQFAQRFLFAILAQKGFLLFLSPYRGRAHRTLLDGDGFYKFLAQCAVRDIVAAPESTQDSPDNARIHGLVFAKACQNNSGGGASLRAPFGERSRRISIRGTHVHAPLLCGARGAYSRLLHGWFVSCGCSDQKSSLHSPQIHPNIRSILRSVPSRKFDCGSEDRESRKHSITERVRSSERISRGFDRPRGAGLQPLCFSLRESQPATQFGFGDCRGTPAAFYQPLFWKPS